LVDGRLWKLEVAGSGPAPQIVVKKEIK